MLRVVYIGFPNHWAESGVTRIRAAHGQPPRWYWSGRTGLACSWGQAGEDRAGLIQGRVDLGLEGEEGRGAVWGDSQDADLGDVSRWRMSENWE